MVDSLTDLVTAVTPRTIERYRATAEDSSSSSDGSPESPEDDRGP
jgi:hypothetical protein